MSQSDYILSLPVANKRQQGQSDSSTKDITDRLVYLNCLCVHEVQSNDRRVHYVDSSCCLTLFSDNLTDSMKEASVARSERTLVMDQFHLEDKGRTILTDTHPFRSVLIK